MLRSLTACSKTAFPAPSFIRASLISQRHYLSSMATSDKSNVPKSEYRQLGKSGLRVSVPIFGCMSFGDKRWQKWVIEEDEALPLLKAAYDRGLNSWDTANVYSNGVSEEIVGKAIKKYNIPRHKLVIMTKCCGTVREGNSPEVMALQDIDKTVDYVNQRGSSSSSPHWTLTKAKWFYSRTLSSRNIRRSRSLPQTPSDPLH